MEKKPFWVIFLGMFLLIFSSSCKSTDTIEQTGVTYRTTQKMSSTFTPEPSSTQMNSTEIYMATEDYQMEEAASDMATLQTRGHTPVVGVSSYYGEWTITEYTPKDTYATPDTTEYGPETHLGETVYLSGEEFISSDEFLFGLNEPCNNPSYRWVPASETTGAASQALLGGHPDTRSGILYLFKVYCGDEVITSFQISASERLILFWAPYWFFLERTGDAPGMTDFDATAVPSTQKPNPSLSPAPPGLIYTHQDGLYVVREEGNSQYLAPDTRGYFSPNYHYLLYEDFGEYYIVDLFTGSRILELDLWDQENESNGKRILGATWSIDNQTIYYSAGYHGEWLTDIWSINLQTGEKTNLTNTTDRIELGPYLMQDQEHLVFRSKHIEDIGMHSTELFSSMKVDGSGYHVYTQLDDTYLFRVSPDGTMAAIFGGELFTIEDGFQQTSPSVIGENIPEEFQLIDPTWSQDSNYIGWSIRSIEGYYAEEGIAIHDVDSNTIKFYYPYNQPWLDYPRGPVISPNNQWMSIISQGNATMQWRIKFLGRDDNEEHVLGEFFNPVWNEDSQRVILNTGYDEYGAYRGVWITDISEWKAHKLDLPDDTYVRFWIDLNYISDWFEVSD